MCPKSAHTVRGVSVKHGHRWCGLFCRSTPTPTHTHAHPTSPLRNPVADWRSAPNRRPRCSQSEAPNQTLPPHPEWPFPQVHVFRHDTPVVFIGSCSLRPALLFYSQRRNRTRHLGSSFPSSVSHYIHFFPLFLTRTLLFQHR